MKPDCFSVMKLSCRASLSNWAGWPIELWASWFRLRVEDIVPTHLFKTSWWSRLSKLSLFVIPTLYVAMDHLIMALRLT